MDIYTRLRKLRKKVKIKNKELYDELEDDFTKCLEDVSYLQAVYCTAQFGDHDWEDREAPIKIFGDADWQECRRCGSARLKPRPTPELRVIEGGNNE